jgi:hypothetical protein
MGWRLADRCAGACDYAVQIVVLLSRSIDSGGDGSREVKPTNGWRYSRSAKEKRMEEQSDWVVRTPIRPGCSRTSPYVRERAGLKAP